MSLRRLWPPDGLWFLMLLGLFTWWVRYHPPWVELLVFEDDARQHVYWTAKFQDPELFQEDILTEFISSPVMDPPGYQLLYWLGTRLLDPLPLSQLMSLGLLLLSIWLLELLAKGLIQERRGRLLLGMLFLFFSLYNFSGGFPRGFAFPLLIGFLMLQQRGAVGWAGLVVVLEALFYPPILLNTLAMAGVELLGALRRDGWGRGLLRRCGALGVGCVVAFGLLLWVYGPSDRELLGRQITVEEAKTMPEFQEHGRSEFFRESTVGFLLFGRSGIGVEYVLGFGIILAAMVATGGIRILRVPGLALHLCWSSLLLFFLAHLLLFRLHLPSRYTLYTLPLALMLTIGASIGPFLEATRGTWTRLGEYIPASIRGRWARWIILAALAAIYAWAQGHLIVKVDPHVVAIESSELQMLSFLESLPKDALIAGHPMDMNNVPLVARRKVLANQELSLPYHMGYYNKIRDRLFDLFQTYYATDWDVVEQFVRRHRIQAMVVNRDHFKQDFLRGMIYYEPFDSFVKERLRGGEKFVLTDPPVERVCFENQRFLVLCWPQ